VSLLLTDVVNQVAALLNAAPNTAASYGNTPDDDKHPLGEIQTAIQNANAYVMDAINSTPGHPHRRLTSSVVTNGSQLPDRVGPIGTVEIQVGATWKVGKPAPYSKVQAWIDNPLTLTLYKGYYAVVDNLIYFTGDSCRVYTVAPVTRGVMTANPTCPDEYFPVLVALALGELCAKEGDMPDVAQYYMSVGKAGLDAIRAQSAVIPPVEAYQQQR
jgi:hypothetical protein